MVTEAELIEKTRESGREFLRETPSAFGGGIDPETGIRFKKGQRVSVVGVGEQITQVQEAEAAQRVAESRQQAEQLEKALRVRAQITIEAAQRGRGFSSRQIRKKLKEAGTSVQDLRLATRVSAAQFAATGVSPAETIRQQQIEQIQEPLGAGVAQRLGIIETAADALPTTTRDVGEVPASVPSIKRVEIATGPDSVDTTPPQPLTEEPEDSPDAGGFFASIGDFIRSADEAVAQRLTRPVGEFVRGTGIRIEEAKEKVQEVRERPTTLGGFVRLISRGEDEQRARLERGPLGDVALGATEGFLEGLEERPVSTAATFGVGAGVGGAVKGAKLLAAGTRAAKPVGAGLKGAGAVAVGVVGTEIAKEIAGAPTPREKGEVLGEVALELGAFGAGARAGGRAVKFLAEPVKTKVPTRKAIEPEFDEFQLEVVRSGKRTTLSKFDIAGEVSPPVRERISTEFREFAGLKPKAERIIPPRKIKVETPFGAIGEEPFFTTTAIQRGGSRISAIGGRTQRVPTSEFEQTPKTVQFLARELAGRKVKVPLSTKRISQAFPKDTKLDVSEIVGIDLLGRAGRPIKKGKRVKRVLGVSEVRKTAETPEFEFFEVETLFKDISKPFSRARGKPQRLRGRITKLKKPVSLDDFADVGFKTAPTRKRPSRKPSAALLQEFEVPTPARKLPPKQIPIRKAAIIKSDFDRVSPSLSAAIAPRLSSSQFKKVGLDLDQVAKVRTKQAPKGRALVKEDIFQEFAPRLKGRTKARQKAVTRQTPKTEQIPKLRLAPSIKVRGRRVPISPFSRFLQPRRIPAPKGKPIKAPDFDDLFSVKKKKRKRIVDEAEFFTPGFTEKILGITKKITRKEAARLARSGDPFAQRAIPQFLD